MGTMNEELVGVALGRGYRRIYNRTRLNFAKFRFRAGFRTVRVCLCVGVCVRALFHPGTCSRRCSVEVLRMYRDDRVKLKFSFKSQALKPKLETLNPKA